GRYGLADNEGVPQRVRRDVLAGDGRAGRRPAAWKEPRAARSRDGSLIRPSGTTLTTNVAASIANTSPGPNTATSTPAAAGPPTLNKPPGKPSRALVCWSCSAGTVSGT